MVASSRHTTIVTTLRQEMVDQGTIIVKTLRQEMVEIRDVATQMRVLHEEVISRIALSQEGRTRAQRNRRKK